MEQEEFFSSFYSLKKLKDYIVQIVCVSDEETEAQRSQVTCLKAHSLLTGQNTGNLFTDPVRALATELRTFLQKAFKYLDESSHVVKPT